MHDKSDPVVDNSKVPHKDGILGSLLESLNILVHFFDLINVVLEETESVKERMHEDLCVLVLPH